MSNPTVPFYPMTHDDAQELIAAIGDNSKLAAPYDATRTYAVKEHCIYGGNVYRCKIPINTPEQWTPGHWEQITIGDELTENSQGLAKLIPVISGDNNNSGYTIASGEYFEANGALYQATGSIPTGYPWSSSAQAVSGTAVNALNGNLPKYVGYVSPSSSKSFTVSNNTRLLVLSIGGGSTKGAWIVNTTSSGSCSSLELASGGDISASTGTNTFTLSNTSSASPEIFAISLAGSISG